MEAEYTKKQSIYFKMFKISKHLWLCSFVALITCTGRQTFCILPLFAILRVNITCVLWVNFFQERFFFSIVYVWYFHSNNCFVNIQEAYIRYECLCTQSLVYYLRTHRKHIQLIFLCKKKMWKNPLPFYLLRN